MSEIVVTTYPFGDPDAVPLELIEDWDPVVNTKGSRYTPEELAEVLKDHCPRVIIAGTEKYTPKLLDLCPDLELISRVGIGLDNLDLRECRARGISVAYTPDAPSIAVAELTVCLMLAALRRVRNVDAAIRAGNWERFIGRQLADCVVGIIGFGRIGSRIAHRLQPWGCSWVAYDIDVKAGAPLGPFNGRFQLGGLLRDADVVTLHIPYNLDNHNFIDLAKLEQMKKDAVLINTSRGELVDENDLACWLVANPEAYACIDTFETEPYRAGRLLQLPNVLMTPHLGSCTRTSRRDMETGAAMAAFDAMTGKDTGKGTDYEMALEA